MVDYDEFEDFKGQLGIFEGGAGSDAVDHKVAREGVRYEFQCQGCGRSTRITVEWPELVAIKYGHNPALIFSRYPQVVQHPMSWTYRPEEGRWGPEAKCPHCGFTFAIRMSPNEPESHLKVGRQRGFINPVGEKQVSDLHR